MNFPRLFLGSSAFLLAVSALAQTGDIEVPRPELRTLQRDFSEEQILRALAAAYPDKVRRVDGGLSINGTRIVWEGGKALPEDAIPEADRFAPYGFYEYTVGSQPPVAALTPEEGQAINAYADFRDAHPAERHPALFNSLYGISDRASAEEVMKWIPFLGLSTRIHRDLAPAFARVDARVRAAAETDPELRAFLASLAQVGGFNYRRIAGTETLSLHSYGIAVDLIPRSYGGKPVYWRWTRDVRSDWYQVPFRDRYVVPDSLIDAFEAEGFVWGGKWFFYDTMHFEYRPEIILLNRDASRKDLRRLERHTPSEL